MDTTFQGPAKILIAMPQLQDPNFYKTVIILINHNEEGAVGLVINRKTDIQLKGLKIPNITIHKDLLDVPIWYGGPCEPERIWFLHRTLQSKTEGSMTLAEGIELSPDLHKLEEGKGPPSLDPQNFKLVSGYGGWVAQQLDAEIQASAWLTSDIDPKLILDTPEEKIWEKAVRNLGIDPAQLATEMSTGLH